MSSFGSIFNNVVITYKNIPMPSTNTGGRELNNPNSFTRKAVLSSADVYGDRLYIKLK